MRVLILLSLALLEIPGVARGQAQTPTVPANPIVTSTRRLQESVRGYLMRAAEETSPEMYAYKPTPAVRSFGEIIGHLATEQYLLCSAALGEKNPDAQEFEKTATTKAALAQALRQSFTYCDRAYQMPDAQAGRWQSMERWGDRTPLSLLVQNIGHNNEHYGNIVTYLRMKGLVPPSSQPAR